MESLPVADIAKASVVAGVAAGRVAAATGKLVSKGLSKVDDVVLRGVGKKVTKGVGAVAGVAGKAVGVAGKAVGVAGKAVGKGLGVAEKGLNTVGMGWMASPMAGIDISKNPMGAALMGAKMNVTRAIDDFKFGNTHTENALGLALFALVYAYGWISNHAELERNAVDCSGEGLLSLCHVGEVVATMGRMMISVWALTLIIIMIIFIIDKIFIATLFKPDTSNDLVSQLASLVVPDETPTSMGVRLAFGWMFSGQLLSAFVIAMACTALYALVYSYWVELRGNQRKERLHYPLHVSIFNITIFVLMMVAQTWATQWWRPGGPPPSSDD